MADPNTPSLDDRIASALTTALPSADIGEILVAAKRRLTRIEQDLAHAERDATDPALPIAKVRSARTKAEDLTFDRRRAVRSVEDLEARLAEVIEAEKRDQRESEHAAALAQRDVLAAKLAERIPAIYAELIGLLSEIVENDARLPTGALSAEAKARNCPGNFYTTGGPVMWLTTSTKLPAFIGGGELVWPTPRRMMMLG